MIPPLIRRSRKYTARKSIAANASELVLIVGMSLLFAESFILLNENKPAFAMGPGPGGCSSYDPKGRENDATITSFKISNGDQTVDVLSNSSATMDVDITKNYTTTFTLQPLNTGVMFDNHNFTQTTFNDSKNGSIWLNIDTPRNYRQSVCQKSIPIGHADTITFTLSYNSMQPHFHLPDTQQVHYLTTKSSVSYYVRWVDNTNSTAKSRLGVNSEDNLGNPIRGINVVLSSGQKIVYTGLTPATFELYDGADYEIEAKDYGDYVFDHWKDGGESFRKIGLCCTASDRTMMAVFRNVNNQSGPTSLPTMPESQSPSQTSPKSIPTEALDNVPPGSATGTSSTASAVPLNSSSGPSSPATGTGTNTGTTMGNHDSSQPSSNTAVSANQSDNLALREKTWILIKPEVWRLQPQIPFMLGAAVAGTVAFVILQKLNKK